MIPVGILTAAATSSFSFLLDVYPGAQAAYSLRKLRSAYTGSCIRVKRSSDNNELNIGFVNNYLDVTAMLAFVGAGNGVCAAWYDQSGNTNNLFSANAKIVVAGVFTGYIIFNGTTDQFLSTTGSNSWNGSQNALFTSVTAPDILTPNGVFGTGSNINIAETGSWGMIYQTVGPTFINWRFGTGQTANDETYTRSSSTAFCIVNTHKIATTENAYLNNAVVKTVTGKLATLANNSSTNILLSFGNGVFWKGFQKEVVLYNSNQSSNISGINTNINTYYSIY